MCGPVAAAFAGAAIGGAIGYSQGGGKGALLGAGFGALGGYAVGGGFAGVGGAVGSTAQGVGLVGIDAAGSAAFLPGASIAGGGGVNAAFTSAFGGLGSAFGGGGLGNFLLSPGFSLGTQVIGFGVNIMGQQQQLAFQEARIAHQQAQLRNRLLAGQQDITARNAALDIQLGILGRQGAVGRGAIRAEQAGRGVLVDVGSAADRTAQLAGDVAFEKLIRKQEVALANRQTRIIASGLQADSALLDFQRRDARRASIFGGAGTALKTATTLSSKFRWNNGQLAFRT